MPLIGETIGAYVDGLAEGVVASDGEAWAALQTETKRLGRLVDDLPVRYVGFVVPDELFVGFGFDLDEKWRHLPDLHLLQLEI